MSKLKREQFKFRKHETIGAEGAEDDSDFLFDCFVDTGDLAALSDTRLNPRIIVGRTGVGKTALLLLLQQKEEHVAVLEPSQLALQYISNSTVIKKLEELGVDLDLFYRLLWRHIFAVELIRLKYRIKNEKDQERFLEKIRNLFFGNRHKKAAMDYLVEWGKQFWEDTEIRVHEVTNKLVEDVKGALGAKSSVFEAKSEGSVELSKEDKLEIIHRAQEVVNSIQIKKLSEVIDTLADDIFNDPQQRFYVLIDKLDEKWVDERLRYRLIRALMETVRDLRKIKTAKIVIALRKDLIDRVFRETRDSGFQEEKYEPFLLKLRWSEEELIRVLDSRINCLVKRQYTKEPVFWTDVFPKKIGRTETKDFVLERTLWRPRDIIQFANVCIEKAIDRPEITASMVKEAEAIYSVQRFRSIADEWIVEYPAILEAAQILKGQKPSFRTGEISQDDVLRIIETVQSASDKRGRGKVYKLVGDVYSGGIETNEFITSLFMIFYSVGLIGIRISTGSKTVWSFRDDIVIRENDITNESSIRICPAFFRVLGVKDH